MNVTYVTSDTVSDALLAAARRDVEVAGVLLGRVIHDAKSVRVLLREICWVSEEHYARQEAYALSIRSEGYVHALGKAEKEQCVAVWFHTHPGQQADPRPSRHDEQVDSEIADLFRLRSGSPHYATMIASPRGEGLAFSGRWEQEPGHATTVTRLWSVGERFRLTLSSGAAQQSLSADFDRNIRAFGPLIQRTLGDLRIGIVGCGGTGSAVAEQLARLGARKLLLIDPDTLSSSNVTRVYGSSPGLVGEPKVEVLAGHLARIAPDALVTFVRGVITKQSVAKQLVGCDLVFGCTDDNAGRLVLSRFASYFMTPVIDCGVLLSSGRGGTLTGIDGRITTLVPGQACLVCRDRVDLARAGTELLSEEERCRRVDEGYAPALSGIEPAVITYTTAVAAMAVSELLERLIGFGPHPRPSELLYRGHDRELSTNIAVPRPGHYCHSATGKIGLGETEPFIEQAWPDSH